MAITDYKNADLVGTSKEVFYAQEYETSELNLMQKQSVPIKFNSGVNDVLEVVIYDKSNNILTQKGFGVYRLIRGAEINKYLVQSTNPEDKGLQNSGYIINLKQLIKDAGFGTGYFRVQLNFMNYRVGSDYNKDHLFIEEISPTRQEIRLLPYNNFFTDNVANTTISFLKDIKNDLNKAYDSFILGKASGDEVYKNISDVLDNIHSNDVANIMKTVLTNQTINTLSSELNIKNFESFYSNVLQTMKIAVVNELLYKNSTIGSEQFGKPYGESLRAYQSSKDFNYYNKQDIINLIINKLKESIMFYMPKRTLQQFTRNTYEGQFIQKFSKPVQISITKNGASFI